MNSMGCPSDALTNERAADAPADTSALWRFFDFYVGPDWVRLQVRPHLLVPLVLLGIIRVGHVALFAVENDEQDLLVGGTVHRRAQIAGDGALHLGSTLTPPAILKVPERLSLAWLGLN